MLSTRLPRMRHLALTWSIPDNYGGMTTVIFDRSRAFEEYGGALVDVLTFDGRVDYPDVVTGLRARGSISDGTTVLNLWDWLREHPLPTGAGRADGVFTPLEPNSEYPAAHRGERVLTRTRLRPGGSDALQVDYYREDGSLLASDRRDCRTAGTLGGRSVVLCDTAGQPLTYFSRITPLYYAWVDAVIGGDDAMVIIDSKTVANTFVNYSRPRTHMVHVVHGSHLRRPDDIESGLSTARHTALKHLDRFAAVVLLTERQKQDVQHVVGPARNLRVIPNSPPPAMSLPTLPPRQRTRGVMLAALLGRKRVDHAIRAVALADAEATVPITLEIYGDGSKRAALEALIARQELDTRVSLHGHVPDARHRLTDASFLLLTSKSEAFALVLLESMANGCLPIAYDIRYGPAELIRDGVNGFLVPDGDVAALAEAIARLQRLPDAAVARMRRQAQRTAARYSAKATTARWSKHMRRILHEKRRTELARVPKALLRRSGLRRLRSRGLGGLR